MEEQETEDQELEVLSPFVTVRGTEVERGEMLPTQRPTRHVLERVVALTAFDHAATCPCVCHRHQPTAKSRKAAYRCRCRGTGRS